MGPVARSHELQECPEFQWVNGHKKRRARQCKVCSLMKPRLEKRSTTKLFCPAFTTNDKARYAALSCKMGLGVCVPELAHVFDLPEFIITPHRDKVLKTEAQCTLLSRLSYPNRNYDMMRRFGRSMGALPRLFDYMGTFQTDTCQSVLLLIRLLECV
ncbi:hypothetical protein BBJ28_00021121 [Nothophytophthora sp. Chile5]|nr:hypothetical protein BBJ28_00021121 [Nothophytophthora sp. Chile5]